MNCDDMIFDYRFVIVNIISHANVKIYPPSLTPAYWKALLILTSKLANRPKSPNNFIFDYLVSDAKYIHMRNTPKDKYETRN